MTSVIGEVLPLAIGVAVSPRWAALGRSRATVAGRPAEGEEETCRSGCLPSTP